MFFYRNKGAGLDWALHINRTLLCTRVRTILNSSPSLNFGRTLDTGSLCVLK